MRRILLRLIGVAACTWLGFVVFPGHTFLEAGTQLTVPMLERLANPGFLSRDLVATHADLQYTAYDEISLFANQTSGLSLDRVLLGQQIASRAAAVLGILLLALATGLSESLALLVAALVNLGARLAGPNLAVIDPEAIPRALAWGPLLLAIGLLSREKPLLAGLFAGIALLYEPALTAPFCILLLVMLIADRRVRKLTRPTVTVICVFVLLLANLAQLQPGMVEEQPIFSSIPSSFVTMQQFRAPFEWVTLWPHGELWSYLAIFVCGMWATVRILPFLSRQLRWVLLALPACGIAGVFLSYVLFDRLRWSFVPHIKPAQWLMFTVCLSVAACLIAGVKAAQAKRPFEAALWFVVPFVVPVRAEILQLAHINFLVGAIVFAAISAFVVSRVSNSRFGAILLAIPLAAIVLLWFPNRRQAADAQMIELAEWVKANTWGSSMFLFPDLNRSNEPGLFRAVSQRALWVDWNGGALVPLFHSFALPWWDRWQQTMQPGYSPKLLQTSLSLPIDYYVLTRAHALADIKPVFKNEEYVIYDANDLRNAAAPLRTAGS